MVSETVAGCETTWFIETISLKSHRMAVMPKKLRMLKKAVQRGCSKRRGEEVLPALRVAVRTYEWILANGKYPPVLPSL
jgi:hypothetical protein